MVVLVAPIAFSTPIMLVRSRMMISKPEIMVNPATQNMRPRMIHTFKSSRSSHEKIDGYMLLMLLVEKVSPYLSVVRFTWSIRYSAAKSS